MAICATLIGDSALIESLGLVPAKVKAEAHKAVELMAMKALVRVKLKLSDDVLRVRTGRLRRSITQTVTEDAAGIMGTVGTNVEYARRHELGFVGTETVQEHLRTIKTAFGKSIKGGAVTFTVGAHARKVNYPPHSFLASAIKELEPEFRAAVKQAADRAMLP
jgi:phage gpG-like protein